MANHDRDDDEWPAEMTPTLRAALDRVQEAYDRLDEPGAFLALEELLTSADPAERLGFLEIVAEFAPEVIRATIDRLSLRDPKAYQLATAHRGGGLSARTS